jgi:hypothetical protein
MAQIRNECQWTFFARERIFEARATKERVLHLRECAEYVFSHRSKRILCLICRIPFVNRMALVHAIAKVSIAIYFHTCINLLLKKADDFEAFTLVRERRFRALVLQNVLGP